MSIFTNHTSLFCVLLSGFISLTSHTVAASDSVKLYTPYTNISVPPGESIDYSIDVINDGSDIANVSVSLAGFPRGWNYIMKSGSYKIRQISVLPDSKRNLVLRVEVPLKVNRGNYRFRVAAGNFGTLPLVVNVSEKGTFKTELTTEQANMQGNSGSTFTFNVELKNGTADKQLYSLRSEAGRGWAVVFKPNYKQATSVEIDANGSEKFSVEIHPPENITAGTYKIPISAVTSSTSADLVLEVVITGSYEMELTTPTGLLSTSVTAGDEKTLELLVRNTGSTELTEISLSSTTPIDWEVDFDPEKINRLEAGGNSIVKATIKVPKKAITGDYATNLNARTPEVTSRASFRIAVKTPLLFGWIGIVIILAALGSVYYLFRKYGRR